VILDPPAAAVPLRRASWLAECASAWLRAEAVDVRVVLATSLDDRGRCGEALGRSLRLHEYVRCGVSTYDAIVS
jgi:hypothetical protein